VTVSGFDSVDAVSYDEEEFGKESFDIARFCHDVCVRENSLLLNHSVVVWKTA
jgi:hypothetical protein